MGKLYPPKIDNILPAFAVDKDNTKNLKIIIPYWLNESVGQNDYSKIKCIIKSALTNAQIDNYTIEKQDIVFDDNEKCYKLFLSIELTDEKKKKYIEGQYYKFQIAFVSDEEGYYSNAGIARYISLPTITISQSNLRNVVGIFSDKKTQEKVYSYSFNLYDEFGNLMESSGEKIHNSMNDIDTDTESKDVWEIQSSLQADINYKISYEVITTGKYQGSSGMKTLSYFETIEPRVGSSYLYAENNFEEGYNRIYLKRHEAETDPRICGNFILLRASHKDNYKNWEKLVDFQIYNWQYENGKNSIFNIYKDFLIEQGTSYKYAIQAYHKHKYKYKEGEEEKEKEVTIYSSKIKNINGEIYSDFEDIFLLDGERQLKIRFNPKIGGIKPNLLETKIDTMGSKYPFFFRNGNVNYKEFSLSGLISMVSDYDNNFTLGDIYYRESPKLIHVDTELSSYNYQKEREFKLKVLSWLTNGKEKVLKAPGEGNYIVRLMNSSLSPNDTLGRMVHSFSSTAYEVADYDFKNLKHFNLIGKPQYIKRIKESCELSGTEQIYPAGDEWYRDIKIDQAIVYTQPGTTIAYGLKDGTSDKITANAFGIVDLSDKLQNSGLSYVRKKTGGWGTPSRIEFSYLNISEDTSDWVYIDYAEKVDSQLDGDKWYTGQGIGKSMKDYLNSLDKKRKISSFPYVIISRKNNKNAASEGGHYCIDITGKFELDNLSSLDSIDDADLEDLKDTVTNTKQTIVYRNLDDFSLGKGLRAKVICPQKQFTFRDQADKDPFTYAV